MVMSDSPVSMHNPGNDAPSEAPAASDAAAQKQMEQAYAQMKRKMAMAEIGKKIKHKIMVLSEKEASVNPLFNRSCPRTRSTRSQGWYSRHRHHGSKRTEDDGIGWTKTSR